jgi:PTH1 family peptidyl-tRNA hydrolase
VADGEKYVLAPFRKAQEKVVVEIIETAAEAVEVILKDGPDAAMNRFNRKNDAAE